MGVRYHSPCTHFLPTLPTQDLSTLAHRFAEYYVYMRGSNESSYRLTKAQWQAKSAELEASVVGDQHTELFAKRYPKTNKALTKGTHWIRMEREQMVLAKKGACKTSMIPNAVNIVKRFRFHFTSLDELFAVVEAELP